MKFRKYVGAFFCLAISFVSSQASAGIPTIDVASLIQSTISALEDIQAVKNLYDQIDNQVKQLEQGVKQIESLTGDKLKDQLLNDAGYKDARRWAPDTYAEVNDLFKAASYSKASYKKMAQAGWSARDSFHIPEADKLFKDVDSDKAKSWQQHEIDSMSGIGVAETSYERVSTIMSDSEALNDDLASTPDLKASVDLLNRNQTQTQFLLAELIRIQSTQTAVIGKQQLYDHSMKADDMSKARFTELPEFK
jgi:hypothetical protein